MDPFNIFLFASVIGLIAYIVKQNSSPKDTSELREISKDLAEFSGVIKTMSGHMTDLNSRVDDRLKENVNMMQRSHKSLNERLDNSSKAFADVKGQLSKLEEGSKRIYDIGKDIASLQDTLRAPKLRGVLGELFLEELLKDLFARDQFTMQYAFQSGHIVDAVVHLRDNKMVPIDSKFSLENFQKIISAKGEDETKKAKRAFRQDIKKRIEEISSKYILPDEGTLNFALMYIPAENVYYEVIIRDEETESLMSYALTKGVFPVSPNTLSVYLTTILSGLRGLEIEKRAQEIMDYLSRLKIDFGKFEGDFELLGKHLGHATSSYANSEKRLDKFGDKLESMNTGRQKDMKLAE